MITFALHTTTPTVHGAAPFSRGVVLMFVLGAAVTVMGIFGFFALTVGRPLRSWALSQGYTLVSWEFPPLYRVPLFDAEYLVTVRDATGALRFGRVRFVGFSFLPFRLDVEWLPSHEPHDVSKPLRFIAVVLGLAALLGLYVVLFDQ